MYFLVFSPKHINPKNILDLLRIEFSGSNLESPINSKERLLTEKIAKEICALYYVTLCQDVLAEVLLFGCRSRLKKLAQIGSLLQNHLSYGQAICSLKCSSTHTKNLFV